MTHILVVEDEPAIALGLRNDLTLEGYSVEVAGDGETASRLAQETAFDLILLDVMLPRRDGFTVARELRRAGLRTPIIVLTARAQEAEKVLGLELGADDYVTKPFSPQNRFDGSSGLPKEQCIVRTKSIPTFSLPRRKHYGGRPQAGHTVLTARAQEAEKVLGPELA